MIQTKVCTICHTEKDLSSFSTREARCKPCNAERVRHHRLNRKKPFSYFSKIKCSSLKVPGKECVKCKQYKILSSFRDCLINADKKLEHCKNCTYKKEKKFSIGRAYRELTSSAKRRGIPINISFEEYETIRTDKVCYYCEGELPMFGHGLDRRESLVGYVLGNVLTCCGTCNRMKGHMSHTDFINLCRRIVNLRGK